METDVLIVGAGLSGLSAAYHLGERDYLVAESDSRVGGLCKSFYVDGFHFDYTGHLIHFRTTEGRKIVSDLLGDRIAEHQRKAAIFISGRFTDYPFQANTYGLPPEIIKECVLGFAETLMNKKKTKISNFYDWVYDMFGSGIAKHFMIPYNEKLWQHDLHDIALDWVNWSIPKPNLEDVLNGALGIKNKQFGYNPVFYYPTEGGIGLLPESFPVKQKVMLGAPVKSVRMKRREVVLNNGEVVRYRLLLSTMPLHALLGIIEDAPTTLANARSKLHYISVLNINLGIDRASVIPYHWIYFPEKEIPFYRLGCASNFSQKNGPPGTSSLYVEISLRSDLNYDVNQLVDESIRCLKKCGILRVDDKIIARFPVVLKYAYVLYDSARSRTVASIQRSLERSGVYSFGRYGSWVYSSMEDAILQGKEFAEKCK